MPRKVKNPKTDSRTAREKLRQRREPYWAKISKGCFLGYRRIAVSGTWIARYRDHDGKQHYRALGAADDSMEANAKTVLNFEQAQDAARAWFKTVAREQDGAKREGRYTVRLAIEDYQRDYEARSGKSGGRMEASINAHILPALGKIEVERLTRQRIRDWHRGLAATAPRLRTTGGEGQLHKGQGNDPDTARKRKATANRVLTVLKAALNFAVVEGEAVDGGAWGAVRPFKDVDAPKVRYLSDDESLRLTNACQDDLRQIVTAALLTGCRYGEIIAIKCGDFDPDSDTLYVATSKSGKPRHIVLTDEGSEFFTQATTGRPKDEIAFKRSTGGAWGRSHQRRPLKDACEKAKINPPASFHILRHSYASRLAGNGVPMKVIAEQLGHVDTRRTEKHYAHLAESYKAETVRAAFGNLGLVKPGKVKPLRRKAKRA